jgi:hypothetical protein
MSDSIDDLLAQIQPASTQPSQAQGANPLPPEPAAPLPHPAKAIENLLADLDSLDAGSAASRPRPNPSQPSANPRFDALLDQTPVQPLNSGLGGAPDLFKAESANQMLADLKALYQEQDQAEALRQQEMLRAEQERQATLKRQRQGAIKQRAQAWLEKLDPASGEAAWFEEFAAKYDSRVAAAIDYLGLEAE